MAEEDALARLRELLTIRTVSRPDPADVEWPEFDSFLAAVVRLYPGVHAALDRELVDGHTLLYRWRGESDGAPSVLMAHYDVVPAADEGWEHPPFAAVVTGERTGEGDERVLWGRGTLDDKGALAAVLQAAEEAVASGFTPRSDIWMCFGHDEETSGSGAQTVARLLEQRGVRPALVLDEGGAIVEGVFPGITAPVAVIGIAEKGSATLTMTVSQQGGHAYAPPSGAKGAMSATARIARAVSRLGAQPFRPRLTDAVRGMTRVMAARANGPAGAALRTLGRFGPFVTGLFGRLGDETRALTRTTAVVTMIDAGHAPNALPERAVATVNVRILPGETLDTVLRHIRGAVADDRVEVQLRNGSNPSPTSPASGPAWDLVESTVAALHPDAVVTPYLMLGATDARHFTGITDAVYRFSPFEMSAAERSGLHGMNERIRVATFLDGVTFYRALIARL